MKRFELETVQPTTVDLVAVPKAWSPGIDGPVDADVVGSRCKVGAGPGKIPREVARQSGAVGIAADDHRALSSRWPGGWTMLNCPEQLNGTGAILRGSCRLVSCANVIVSDDIPRAKALRL